MRDEKAARNAQRLILVFVIVFWGLVFHKHIASLASHVLQVI